MGAGRHCVKDCMSKREKDQKVHESKCFKNKKTYLKTLLTKKTQKNEAIKRLSTVFVFKSLESMLSFATFGCLESFDSKF